MNENALHQALKLKEEIVFLYNVRRRFSTKFKKSMKKLDNSDHPFFVAKIRQVKAWIPNA